jgi:hypothetical protein
MQTARQSTFKITPPIRQEIIKIVDARIKEAHVTKEDFSELKNIVRDLAAAQKRTEIKIEELATAQKELAEAQKRTELKIEEMAEAQKDMAVEINKLTKSLTGEIGGIGRSLGYALENEAYRHLPELLKRKYGIDVKEKIIRAQVGGKEINVFGRAEKDGREVFVVGEAKVRLDECREINEDFDELEEKVQAVMAEYGQKEIVKILVAHYARKLALDMARDKGIIVVQSFEW